MQALKELNVTCTTPKKTTTDSLQQHLANIKSKRDKQTLQHKRHLAEAFKQSEGFSKRYVKSTQKSPAYSRKNLPKLQADIHDLYNQNAVEDRCKSSKRRQLTKSVKELPKDSLTKSRLNVSLRSFHRHKPKDIKSVRKMKFRQCLCEICLNPKLKVSSLNQLSHKSESVCELLNESMCGFEGVPHLLCVDRKCCECGTACVMRRLKEEFGELVQKSVSWSRWEVVKQGRTSRVEKVKRSGMVGDCTAELGQELGPLCRHVFNAEWQRQQLQLLKANLPTGWVLATCDFVENFLCRSQDEPQSTGVQAGDHFSCGLFLQVYFWMWKSQAGIAGFLFYKWPQSWCSYGASMHAAGIAAPYKCAVCQKGDHGEQQLCSSI